MWAGILCLRPSAEKSGFAKGMGVVHFSPTRDIHIHSKPSWYFSYVCTWRFSPPQVTSTMANNNFDNAEPNGPRATQAILDAIADLRADLTTQMTRLENTQRRMLNSRQPHFLVPLLHPVTRVEIQDCPTTIAQIFRLSGAEAICILQALQVPVHQFTLTR